MPAQAHRLPAIRKMWIRSPAWDGFWILSAPALGLLMLVPLAVPLPTKAISAVLLCVNFGHALSPIALAWSHRGFRAVMLQRPSKYIGIPAAVLFTGTVAAVGTWLFFPAFQPHHVVLEKVKLAELSVPLVLWANIYAIWNLYHAGAQNFGILCLYRGRGFAPLRRKLVVLAVCVAITIAAGHELSRIFPSQVLILFCLGLVTVNHWLAAIGLSAHVHAQHKDCSPVWFAAGTIGLGAVLVWGFYVAVSASLHAAIMALCLRGALGIWHFLQDRWVWKLSNPKVRETIGRDLFPHRQ